MNVLPGYSWDFYKIRALMKDLDIPVFMANDTTLRPEAGEEGQNCCLDLLQNV